jgi:hypothetical protein
MRKEIDVTRFRAQLGFAAFAAVVLCSLPAAAQTDPRTYFEVSFSGIICHARWENSTNTTPPSCYKPDLQRRAIIIKGNHLTMRHHATLFFPLSIPPNDKKDLEKWAGHKVKCDVNTCGVRIDGLDMRIRGDGRQPPLGALDVTPVYCNSVPHLKTDTDIDGGDLDPLYMSNDLPSGNAAGYFEIEGGGSLDACLYRQGGIFVASDGKVLSHTCRRFADEVRWTGTTTGTATLEVRSRTTPNKDWQPVNINNSDKLFLRIETVTSAHGTPRHFALHEKVLVSKRLPKILPCDPADGTDVPCTSAFVDVPGCSDTNWP